MRIRVNVSTMTLLVKEACLGCLVSGDWFPQADGRPIPKYNGKILMVARDFLSAFAQQDIGMANQLHCRSVLRSALPLTRNASTSWMGGVPRALSVDSAPNGNSMTDTRSLISIVDDDESLRESLPDLLIELGFATLVFSSAEEFLGSADVLRTECLILDIAMPGIGGLELQYELRRRGVRMPIIFITGRQDETVRRDTVEQGAVDCLLKPFSDIALINALKKAFEDK